MKLISPSIVLLFLCSLLLVSCGNESYSNEHTIQDPSRIKENIRIQLKYWDYVHKQPKENRIYANHVLYDYQDQQEDYTVILYKNTKPEFLTKHLPLKNELYKTVFYKDDVHAYLSKQDSIALRFKKGLYDINEKRQEGYRDDSETIIWDEEKRLLYYHVSWGTY